MANIFYVDGEFVESSKATIPVDDLALLRGYGVFDFLRTYNGRPFYLTAHIARLFRSAQKIGLAIPWSAAQIEDIVIRTLSRNDHAESNIRILVTGGTSPDGICPSGDSRLLVMVTPVKKMPASWYEEGVKLVSYRTERLFPDAKSINYIAGILALQKACREDAVEALYIGKDDRVLECTTSNFFCFSGDTLVTPGSGVLPGVTRQVILDIATDLYKIETRDIFVDELPTFDEILITSSNKEVLPVVRIDDRVIREGTPGPRTRNLLATFRKFVREYGRNKDWPLL